MTDVNVTVEEVEISGRKKVFVTGKNEVSGWLMTFTTNGDETQGMNCMNITMKLPYEQIVQIRDELKELGYDKNVFKSFSGIRVENSVDCCIDLLRKIKARA
jgi:hypothetical protein